MRGLAAVTVCWGSPPIALCWNRVGVGVDLYHLSVRCHHCQLFGFRYHPISANRGLPRESNVAELRTLPYGTLGWWCPVSRLERFEVAYTQIDLFALGRRCRFPIDESESQAGFKCGAGFLSCF